MTAKRDSRLKQLRTPKFQTFLDLFMHAKISANLPVSSRDISANIMKGV